MQTKKYEKGIDKRKNTCYNNYRCHTEYEFQ